MTIATHPLTKTFLLFVSVFVLIATIFSLPPTAYAVDVFTGSDGTLLNAPEGAGVPQPEAPEEGKLECSWGDVGACIVVRLAQIFFYVVPALIAGLAGFMFDIFAYISLDGTTYTGSDGGTTKLVDQTWQTIRDFLNIFFIGALLWIALRTILDIGTNTQRLLINVVVAALIMNLSLFAVRAAIDVSNISSLVFYNAVSQENKNRVPGSGNPGIPSLSGNILGTFNPQRIYTGSGSRSQDIDEDNYIQITTAFILAGLISLVMIFVFFTLAWIFIVRTVLLLLLCITSPIPVIAHMIPWKKAEELKETWLQTLMGQVFVAPIFFFLMYIVFSLQNAAFQKIAFEGNTPGDTAVAAKMVEILIPMLVVCYGIIKSASIAKAMSAKGAAGAVSGMLGTIAGGAIGGVGGFLGRKVLGGAIAGNALKGLQGSQLGQKWATGNMAQRYMYNATRGALKTATEGTYDARNAPKALADRANKVTFGAAGKLATAGGIDMTKPAGGTWGKGTTQNYKQELDARKARDLKEEKEKLDSVLKAVSEKSAIAAGHTYTEKDAQGNDVVRGDVKKAKKALESRYFESLKSSNEGITSYVKDAGLVGGATLVGALAGPLGAAAAGSVALRMVARRRGSDETVLEDKKTKAEKEKERIETRKARAAEMAPRIIEKKLLEKIVKEKEKEYETRLKEVQDAQKFGENGPLAEQLKADAEKVKSELETAVSNLEAKKQEIEEGVSKFKEQDKKAKEGGGGKKKEGGGDKKEEKKGGDEEQEDEHKK